MDIDERGGKHAGRGIFDKFSVEEGSEYSCRF